MDLERVLLFTGGLDSTIAWRLLGRPACIYVELGNPIGRRQSRGERDMKAVAEQFGINWKIVWAPWNVITMPDGHVPLRNLHLVTAAAVYSNRIVLGAVKGESSPDKSDAFLKAAGTALTEASQGRKIRIEAPLKHWTKTQLVSRLITEVGFDEASLLIAATRSCYALEGRCGRCMACFRRWVALASNGIYEAHDEPPWDFPLPPWEARMRYLRQAPMSEWPGILRNNLEAFSALHFRR